MQPAKTIHIKTHTWVLAEIANGRLAAVIDTEIIQEILYRYGSIQAWRVGVQMAQNLLDLVPTVLPVTADEMKTAVSLFNQYAPKGVKLTLPRLETVGVSKQPNILAIIFAARRGAHRQTQVQ